jgi:DNA-binding NarL/FixJ family response regulator
MNLRLLLADDQEVVRQGLCSVLDKPNIKIIGHAATGKQAVELARQFEPDVVIMDISMPGLNGIDATAAITAEVPRSRVVVLSMYCERPYIIAALRAGAKGYLLKSGAAAEVYTAVQAVAGGNTYITPAVAEQLITGCDGDGDGAAFVLLSPREREVLQLLAQGLSSKQIAARIGIGTRTVETHRAQIMNKLGLRSVAELTRYALRQGLLLPD